MEIKTHVLTTEQHLEPNRKKRARKNIEAIGSIAVNGETVTPEAGEDSVDLSGYTVPTPSTANKIFGWASFLLLNMAYALPIPDNNVWLLTHLTMDSVSEPPNLNIICDSVFTPSFSE